MELRVRGRVRRAASTALALAIVVATVGVAGPAHAQVDGQACTLCAGGEFFPVTPTRVFDTRNGTGGRNVALPFGQSADVAVTNVAGVPATGVLAVALNVTVDAPSQPGFLTVSPSGAGVPVASNLNFTPGNPVANFVVVGVGGNGAVTVTPGPPVPNASTAVIVDVVGYYAMAPGCGRCHRRACSTRATEPVACRARSATTPPSTSNCAASAASRTAGRSPP